jgi:outer membrane protein assembly factor BamB
MPTRRSQLVTALFLLLTSSTFSQDAISVNLADNATLSHLKRFDALLVEKQWSEAIETIRQVAESGSDQVVRVTPQQSGFRRYLPLSTYCQMKLANLAMDNAEALALYRQQIDPVANRLFRSASERNDESALRELVTKYFASSASDDALLLLGEYALERSDWTAARDCWEQVSPLMRFPASDAPQFSEFAGQPRWLITRHLETEDDWKRTLPLLAACDAAPSWLAYRDTDVKLADVQARLALVSILEGNGPRARAEIELLHRMFPDASGSIGGRTEKYVTLLERLLDESKTWPQNTRSIGDFEHLTLRWQLPLPTLSATGELIGSEGTRVAESSTALLSYQPIVIDKKVIVQVGPDEANVVARRVDDGSVVFGPSELPKGTWTSPGLKRSVGVPRYPLSSHGNTVYARVGSLPTGVSVDLRQEREEPARIIGLDLESEGRLTVELRLEGPQWDKEWAFDGVPVSDGQSLYIALRHRSSVRSENYVGCFDARTGRLRWRRMIVGAEPFGSRRPFELTHTLLTLRHNTLYCNTNLGVVAAIDVDDGKIKWITEYPRVDLHDDNPDRNALHLFRDLTPCLLYRDLVIAAPMDCEQIFALNANTGILIWASLREQAADAIHLLGVGQDHLIASGDYLYWFDAYTGRLVSQFPAPHRSLPGHAKPSPHGYGRGILGDKYVYWPTRESIIVFDQRIDRKTIGRSPQPVRTISFNHHDSPTGNLVLTDEFLLVAAANRLIVFARDGKRNDTSD